MASSTRMEVEAVLQRIFGRQTDKGFVKNLGQTNLIGLVAHGAFRLEQLGMSALAIVPALAGMWLGQIVRVRISPKLFRRCFLMFLALLGLELASRPFR